MLHCATAPSHGASSSHPSRLFDLKLTASIDARLSIFFFCHFLIVSTLIKREGALVVYDRWRLREARCSQSALLLHHGNEHQLLRAL